jgi:hypothetical protein
MAVMRVSPASTYISSLRSPHWGTRVIWRKLDCLKSNLQGRNLPVHRKDACDRCLTLRWYGFGAAATSGVWSDA